MKIKPIDEEMLKKLITERHTAKYIANHFGVCERVIRRRVKLLSLKLNPPKTISTETRKKISIGRRLYLSNNPDKHPWRNNNKFKSHPCELVKSYLKSINLSFEPEYQPLLNLGKNYAIDIAFPDKLIGIEINGNQHYESNGLLKPYYETRRIEIENIGWKLYQIHYSICYKPELLSTIIKSITNSETKAEFNYETYKRPEKKIKPSLIDPFWNNKPKLKLRKGTWPSKEDLELMINIKPVTSIARAYNVSGTTVKKWCESYGIQTKPRGYWSPFKSTTFNYNRTKPRPNTRRVVRPDKNELENLIQQLPMTKIGKKFGVSDNTIRKWCKCYKIDISCRWRILSNKLAGATGDDPVPAESKSALLPITIHSNN